MKKIIFTSDFLYFSQKHIFKDSLFLQKLFYPIIKDILKSEVEIYFDVRTRKEIFSREYFFQLGNLNNISQTYNSYDIKNFNENQKEYLAKFIDKDTIIIGFELYNLTEHLTSLGCKVIDFAHHSYKLFNDNTFAISTNDINIHNQLLKYQVPQDKFYYYANYWKVFMEHNNLIPDKKIKDNACLFIGQTLKDRSVDKDGVFLNVTHFEEKLKELSKQYSNVYYIPHPGLGRKRKVIYDFIKKCPYIELLENCSTYGLLASDKVKKVVAISTSVLYEAQYFGKEIEYLYKPLFNIDAPFEEHSYISVHEDYWNPKFWADILSPVCDVKEDVKDVNYFKGQNNMIRNVKNTYWGYAQLDPIKRLPSLWNIWKRFYYKYIAKLIG